MQTAMTALLALYEVYMMLIKAIYNVMMVYDIMQLKKCIKNAVQTLNTHLFYDEHVLMFEIWIHIHFDMFSGT